MEGRRGTGLSRWEAVKVREAAGSGRQSIAASLMSEGAGASSWRGGREIRCIGWEWAGTSPEGFRCGRETRALNGRPGSGQGQNCLP